MSSSPGGFGTGFSGFVSEQDTVWPWFYGFCRSRQLLCTVRFTWSLWFRQKVNSDVSSCSSLPHSGCLDWLHFPGNQDTAAPQRPFITGSEGMKKNTIQMCLIGTHGNENSWGVSWAVSVITTTNQTPVVSWRNSCCEKLSLTLSLPKPSDSYQHHSLRVILVKDEHL